MMARFSGKQYKGAARDVAEAKRVEAEKRQAAESKRFNLGGWLKSGIFTEITPAQRAGNATRHTRTLRTRRSDAEAHDLAADRA